MNRIHIRAKVPSFLHRILSISLWPFYRFPQLCLFIAFGISSVFRFQYIIVLKVILILMVVMRVPQIDGLISLPFQYFLPFDFFLSSSFLDKLRCLTILVKYVRHLAVYAFMTIVFFLESWSLLKYSNIGYLTLSIHPGIITVRVLVLDFVERMLKLMLILVLLLLLLVLRLVFQEAIQERGNRWLIGSLGCWLLMRGLVIVRRKMCQRALRESGAVPEICTFRC